MARIPSGSISPQRAQRTQRGTGGLGNSRKGGPEKAEEAFVFFGPLGFSSGSDPVLSVSSVVK
jgi:hypothetical protein